MLASLTITMGSAFPADRITNWAVRTLAEGNVRLRRKAPTGNSEIISAERLEMDHASGTIEVAAKDKGSPESVNSLRETLRERLKAVEEAHKAGEAGSVDVLTAARELYEVEVIAAESLEERRNAQRALVNQLKQLKSALETLYRAKEVDGRK